MSSDEHGHEVITQLLAGEIRISYVHQESQQGWISHLQDGL